MERFTRNNSGTLIDLTNKEDVGLLVKRSRSSTDNLAVSFLPCGDLEDEKFASPRTNKKASLIRWHSGSFVTELVHEKLEDIDLSPSSRAQHRKKELAALTTLLDAESHSHTLSESLVPLGGREERLSQSSSE